MALIYFLPSLGCLPVSHDTWPKKGRKPCGGQYVAEYSAAQKIGSYVTDNSHVQINLGPKPEIGTLSEATGLAVLVY